MKLLFTQQDMPAARRRRMMAERAAEGEDAEAEDVPMVESIENLKDTSVSNPFYQITTRFHLLSEYVKCSATLPHVRFIWARSTC